MMASRAAAGSGGGGPLGKGASSAVAGVSIDPASFFDEDHDPADDFHLAMAMGAGAQGGWVVCGARAQGKWGGPVLVAGTGCGGSRWGSTWKPSLWAMRGKGPR